MTVVSDAGPLMALAKIGGLDLLFRLFPRVLTPPAVYHELIVEGRRLEAPDVEHLEARYRSDELLVVLPRTPSLGRLALLGPGEEQSIQLAIENQADWLLADDLDARVSALASFQAAGSPTRLKGTLGIILAAHEAGHLVKKDAVELVEILRQRPDIWISAALCDRVRDLLEKSAGE